MVGFFLPRTHGVRGTLRAIEDRLLIDGEFVLRYETDEAPRYLIRDRDQVYGVAVRHRLRALGIRDKPIAPGSPWQNGFAERLIGSIRRECADRVIALGEAPRDSASLCPLLQRSENAPIV